MFFLLPFLFCSEISADMKCYWLMTFEKECCSLWRWDNLSSSKRQFPLLRPINRSVPNRYKSFQSFYTTHTLRFILSNGWLLPPPFYISLSLFVKLISLHLFMLMSVGTWAHLGCVDFSAKSATHWPSLITFPGNFLRTLSLWSSSGKYRVLQR